MAHFSTFHRRLNDKFRVSLNPPFPAFIAVIHKDKGSDNFSFEPHFPNKKQKSASPCSPPSGLFMYYGLTACNKITGVVGCGFENY